MSAAHRDSGAIVVTGANRGIGAGIALELARRGYCVAALTRTGQIAAEHEPYAGQVCGFACDVTDTAALSAALAAAAGRFGQLRGLVNNAGLHLYGHSKEFSDTDFDRVMRVNAHAPFAACRQAFPYLEQRPGALIVNIGSFFDRLGVKNNVAYCASKAALGAITRCLAVEWASAGIRVINVAPGYVATDLNREALSAGPLAAYLRGRIPSGAPGSAEDVARLIGALYCEDLPFLTGETIYIDGGQSIAH